MITETSWNILLSYIYEIPPDGEWGRKLNGKWTGLVGQMERLGADIEVAPLAMHHEREEVMDFVPVPYYNDYTTVLLKRLDPSLSKWRTLTDPFGWEVHVTISLALPVITVVLYIAETINPYYDQRTNSKSRKRASATNEIFWYLLACLFSEGGPYIPTSLTGRTVVSTWWIYCIIIAGIYCANLIAFLSVPKFGLPFENLEELADQTDYTWGTIGGTSLEQILKDSKLTVYKKLWKGIVEFNKTDHDVLHLQASNHIDKVRDGGYAFIGDGTAMEIRMAQDCELLTTGEHFMPLQYTIGLTNNSPFKTAFIKELLAITEFGLMQQWKQKWWPRGNKCLGESFVGKPITVIDIQSLFYAGFGMVFIAFIVMFCELFKHRRINEQKRSLIS